MIHVLGDSNSLFNQFLSEIRDEVIQKDPSPFQEKYGTCWRNFRL